LFTGLSHVRGMTVDMSAQQMYWTSPGTGQILRANLDGTGPVHAVINDAGNGVAGVAVDAVKGKVYWTDFDTSLSSGTIRRSNLNGTDAEVVVTDAGRHPVGVALDIINGKVYWTDLQDTLDGKGRIIRSNLDGSNSETIITGIDEANGIAVDALGGKIYWPESTSGTIQCANLDGSDVQILVQGLDTPTTIGLDPVADKMYWTDALWEGEQWNRIERASFDGSSRETVVSDLGVPWGIAVVPEPSCLTIGSAGLVILALRRPSSRSPGRRQL
jgi:DNA-binding beta-propeller fold protein YncE